MRSSIPALHISRSPGASVVKTGENSWYFEIPANSKRGYRLAQLDDQGTYRRADFLWKPPLTFSLQARISADQLPGTWGFGFWNDPFSFLLANNKVVPRLPALPEAAWFFYASSQNYLSFRNDLAASGFLAATFRSKKVPFALIALASPIMALTLFPGLAQLVRRLLRRVIEQDAAPVQTNVTGWHAYKLEWEPDLVMLSLDGALVLQTTVAPAGPMSLVIWVDNQYAALPPKGGVRYGTLPNPEPAWMDIRDLEVLDQVMK